MCSIYKPNTSTGLLVYQDSLVGGILNIDYSNIGILIDLLCNLDHHFINTSYRLYLKWTTIYFFEWNISCWNQYFRVFYTNTNTNTSKSSQ